MTGLSTGGAEVGERSGDAKDGEASEVAASRGQQATEEASGKAAEWHFGEMAKVCKREAVLCKAQELLALTGKAVEPLGVTGKALELVLASG